MATPVLRIAADVTLTVGNMTVGRGELQVDGRVIDNGAFAAADRHGLKITREAGMDGFYFSAKLDDQTTLCLAPLTDQAICQSGQEVPDPSGHWLYEVDEHGRVDLIAQVPTHEAAWRLRGLLGLR